MVKEKHLRSVAFFQGSAFKQLRGKFYTMYKRYQKHSILNRPNKLFGLNFALNQSLKKTVNYLERFSCPSPPGIFFLNADGDHSCKASDSFVVCMLTIIE